MITITKNGEIQGPQEEQEELSKLDYENLKEFPIVYYKGWWIYKINSETLAVSKKPDIKLTINKIKDFLFHCYLWELNPLPKLREALKIRIIFGDWDKVNFPNNPRKGKSILLVNWNKTKELVSFAYWNGHTFVYKDGKYENL